MYKSLIDAVSSLSCVAPIVLQHGDSLISNTQQWTNWENFCGVSVVAVKLKYFCFVEWGAVWLGY
jgi:hypothetical protein